MTSCSIACFAQDKNDFFKFLIVAGKFIGLFFTKKPTIFMQHRGFNQTANYDYFAASASVVIFTVILSPTFGT